MKKILNILLIVIVGFLFWTCKEVIDKKANLNNGLEIYESVSSYINVNDENFPEVDFQELLTINQDVIGWLDIPDTIISYPVVSTTDNSFYLHHDYSKNRNEFGSVFLDSDCSLDSDVIVLHGHNFNLATEKRYMFTTLTDFKDKKNFEKCTKFYFLTSKQNFVYDVLALIHFDSSNLNQWNYFKEMNLKYIKENNLYFNENVSGEKYMILSTCDRSEGYGKNGRLLLIGVLRKE